MPSKVVPHLLPETWTDDLPQCEFTGKAQCPNVIIKRTGGGESSTGEHDYEDTYFRVSHESGVSLYGLFDGHDGVGAAEFAKAKLPAELLFGQISDVSSDEEVKEAIRLAFDQVERGYFSSIGDDLASRTHIKQRLPPGLSLMEATQCYPQVVGALEQIETRICAGATAALCIVVADRLFVATLGDVRVLLCRRDSQRQLRVLQLNHDHATTNPEEFDRLHRLGLDESTLQHCHWPTRAFGCFPRKGGYKDVDILCQARSEPVIAVPDITGPFALDETAAFMLMLTKGVYHSLEQATGSVDLNTDLSCMVATEFMQQSSINQVAQSVVDHIARLYYDAVSQPYSNISATREDMTLLVRNFNQELLGHLNSTLPSTIGGGLEETITTVDGHTTTATATGSVHGPVIVEERCDTREINTLDLLDENGRIGAYVSFESFYRNQELFKQSQGIVDVVDGPPKVNFEP